ncbi:hypothetical protein DFAR_3850003 [Desulfarculales bacterium]
MDNSPDQMAEAISQMEAYTGMPLVNQGLKALKQILGKNAVRGRRPRPRAKSSGSAGCGGGSL